MMQHLTPILVSLHHDPQITPLFNEGLKLFSRGEAKLALPYFNAIANGHKYPPALFFLGFMYSKGIGVTVDLAMSTKLYKDAALQLLDLGIHLQHPQLQIDLGVYRCIENDYDRALVHFHSAAEKGYINELFNLGNTFHIGQEVLPNPAIAAACYIAAAQQGHIEAQYHLALHFYNGFGVEQNFETAAQWFLNAAEQGHTEAQVCSGNIFLQGIGVPKSESKAVRYFFNAAEKNHPLALRHLGYCFLFGLGVQKELKESNFWFRRAATQHDEVSQQFLQQHPPETWNTRKGYENACKWFVPVNNTIPAVNKKPAAAVERKSNSRGLIWKPKDKNLAPSKNVVYTILKPNGSIQEKPNTPIETKASTNMQIVQNSAAKNPININIQQKNAMALLQQLQQADIRKFLNPALTFDKTTAFIRKIIFAESAEFHKNSIQAGALSPKNDSEAQYRLALHYLELGFFNKAKYFLEKAAHQNHIEAQYVLGMGYLQFGYIRQGRAWLENIAAQGHKRAQSVLNNLLNPNITQSNSTRKESHRFFNPKNTIEFRKSKLLTLESKNTPEFDILNTNIVFSEDDKQQWAKIHYLFGRKFFDGSDEFKQSYINAAKQFQQAAALNYPDAQYRYALCFLKGHGVKKCKITAIEWFEKAAANNHLKAKNELDKLKNPGKKRISKDSSIPQSQQSNKKQDGKKEISEVKPQPQPKSSDKEITENFDFSFATLQEKIIFSEALSHYPLAYDLGHKYYTGNTIEKDYRKAIKLFTTYANKSGNFASLYYVGLCYIEGGFGIEKNEQDAHKNFSKAYDQFFRDAQSGNAAANYFLGCYHLFGYGIQQQNIDRALTYFLKAEESGFSHYETHYHIGWCYYQIGNHESLHKAAFWMSKALEGGKAEAKPILLALSSQGITADTSAKPVETKSETKNVSSNTKEITPEQSTAQQTFVASDLIIPEQKKELPDAATIEEEYLHKSHEYLALEQYKNTETQLLKLIKEHKYPPAYIYMGTLSQLEGKDGSCWYTLAKKFEAFFLAENNDPLRKFYSGLYYAFVLNNMDRAFDYFKSASDSGISRAQVFMSHYYFNKESPYFDSATGIATIRRAIAKGKTEARMIIIRFLKSQKIDVFKELETGALNGEPYAQVALGAYYYDSKDIPNKYEKAITWFIKAAKLGHSQANYYLSLCYFHGHGTKPHLKAAFDSAQFALEQGLKAQKRQILLNNIEAMSYIMNTPDSSSTTTVSKLDTKQEEPKEKEKSKATKKRNKSKDLNLQSSNSSSFFADNHVAENETPNPQPVPKME